MTTTPQQPRDYFGDNLTAEEREARRLAREQQQTLDNRRLGLLIFQISWFMAFIALTVVNWQLRFSYSSWPPPNVEAMGVVLPTIATLLLLGGVMFARRARQQIMMDATNDFLRSWAWVIGMGTVFVLVMAYEWVHVGLVDVTDSQYQSVFRLMTGFHSLHALAVGAYMVNIWRNARHAMQVDAGQASDDANVVRYGSDNYWPIESAAKMWDFVFIAWLLFYIVLYWWRS